MRGVTARRRVVHFGWDYGYDAWTLTPAAPLPAALEPLRTQAAGLAGCAPAALEQVLVAQYPAGAGIGWHRDAPMFGPVVVGFSFGAAVVMRFRRRTPEGSTIYRQPLAPGSAYVLAGAARATWQHGIASTPGLRWSVTFRTLRRRPPAAPPPPPPPGRP
jgi:alkylated DNA repair dioxygenase AlkB